MRKYINKYGFVDSSEKDKINTIIEEQQAIIKNCGIRIKRLQNSWLQTTKDLSWKYSSFANNERALIDKASSSIKKAKHILKQINEIVDFEY